METIAKDLNMMFDLFYFEQISFDVEHSTSNKNKKNKRIKYEYTGSPFWN